MRCADFAPRPFPAAEQHCHELIVKYLHAAYPQAPTAVPKQPEVRVEAHTGECSCKIEVSVVATRAPSRPAFLALRFRS